MGNKVDIGLVKRNRKSKNKEEKNSKMEQRKNNFKD
jgi:hypothetical protein